MTILNLYRRIKTSSLSNDFLIIVFIFIFLTIVIASCFSFYLYQDQSQQNIAVLNLVSKKIERSITDDIDYTKYQMEYIANQIQQKGDKPQFIHDLLSTFRVNTKVNLAISWNMFSWMDKNKFIIIDGTEGILKKPIDLSVRDYIPKTINDPKKIYIGTPVYGAVSKQWIIPAGMGVVDKNGKYIGSIVFGFDIGNLIYKLEGIVNSEAINFILLNDANKILVKSSNFNMEESALSKLIQDNGDNSVLSIQSIFDKADSFIISSKITRYPLKIIVQYDSTLSYYEMWNQWSFYIIQFAIALIFIIILLFVLRIRVISPIINLSNAAELIADGNINVLIPNYQSIEASNLAKALINVKNYIKKEKELNKQLDLAKIEAEKANQFKSNFLKNTSHDLKNYIFAISGLSNLILQNKSSKQIEENEDLKLVKVIGNQTIGLQYFLEDLLSDKTTSLGEFSLGEMIDCDVNQIMDDIILLNQNQANSNEISIKKNLDKNLPKLRCDVDRFKQIMMNVIGNALKYSNNNTSITITTKYIAQYPEIQNQIYIEVKDEGIGMTPEEVKMALDGEGVKILKTGLKVPVTSYGLGMKTIKRLVELHHGGLEITSTKYKGTTVGLYFNSDSSDNKKIRVEVQKQFKILNIDDNKVNLMMTQKRIETHLPNIKCDTIDNGENGIEMLRNNNCYSLILMDIDMPEMNGIQTTEIIREFNKNIPIIAFSTRDVEEIKNHIGKEKINYYLSKQANNLLFFRSINKWLFNQNDNFDYLNSDLDNDEKLKLLLSGKNIILADDRKTNLMVVSKYLQSYNINVEIAHNGQELLEIYKQNQNKFDLVITDIEMPILKGDMVVKEIRETNKIIPIIAMTANEAKHDVMKLFDIGVDDHFVKGGDFKNLINIIAVWIKIKNGN